MRARYLSLLALGALAALGGLVISFSSENAIQDPAEIERISVEAARSRAQAGNAILVCAYNDQQCEGKMLEGALTRREFEQKLPSLSKEEEIIIYCA